MPKIEKDKGKGRTNDKSQKLDEDFAFKSVKLSLILGIVVLFVSLCFNLLDILTLFEFDDNILIDILDISIKIASPMLFFLFIMASLGNYGDLLGKPIDWKATLGIFFLTLAQTIRNTIVLGGTFLGLLIIIIYLYLLQER